MIGKFILHTQHLTLAVHIHLLLRDTGSHDAGVDRMAEGVEAVRKGLMRSQVVTAVGFQWEYGSLAVYAILSIVDAHED